MSFKCNIRGGWIIPSFETIPERTIIPPNSEIGVGVRFLAGCEIGRRTIVGDNAELGEQSHIRGAVKFGNQLKAADNVVFDGDIVVGNHATFGNCVTFGTCAKIGDSAHIGAGSRFGHIPSFGHRVQLHDDVTIGNWPMFGESLVFGNNVTIDGGVVRDLIIVSNVDGSGRQVIIYRRDDGPYVRAGCFFGTLDEFVKRATAEDKHRYAEVVSWNANFLMATEIPKRVGYPVA